MKWLDNENLVRSSVQLASDGRWEDAVPIENTDPLALRRWLAESRPDVAIESVYRTASGSLQGFLSTAEQKPATWRCKTRPLAARQAPWRARSPHSWRVPWRIGPQGQSCDW